MDLSSISSSIKAGASSINSAVTSATSTIGSSVPSSLSSVVSSVMDNLMPLGWQLPNTIGIHASHFCTITASGKGFKPVRGRLRSFSIGMQAQWASSTETNDISEQLSSVANALQSGEKAKQASKVANMFGASGVAKAITQAGDALSGQTLQTRASTVQLWTGSQPANISMELEFKAYMEPNLEVAQPIAELFKMISPQLKDDGVDMVVDAVKKTTDAIAKGDGKVPPNLASQVPPLVSISLLDKRFNMIYVLESVNVSTDRIKVDGSGTQIEAVVSLEFGSRYTISQSDVQGGGLLSGILPF